MKRPGRADLKEINKILYSPFQIKFDKPINYHIWKQKIAGSPR